MARRSDNLRMLGKLLVVTLGMFAFGYLLIPAYKAICEATGVNILSLTERQVPGNGVGLSGYGVHIFQQGGNAARVLGTNPVELEAVGHLQRDLGKVRRHLCGQGLDPGVEQLFGQLLRQLLSTRQPQALGGIVALRGGHG